MKKALALVLALVMVLSMAVSAFAVIIETDFKAETTSKKYDVSFKWTDNTDNLVDFLGLNKIFLFTGEGGTWYTPVDGTFKTLDVTVDNDFVTAELVDYDPETMEGGEVAFGIQYDIFDKDATDNPLTEDDETNVTENIITNYNEKNTPIIEKVADGYYKYDDLKKACKWANNQKDVRTNRYYVDTDSVTKLLKLTVAENFTVDYKEATVKILATGKATGKDDHGRTKYDTKSYTAKFTVISDVAIFEHEAITYDVEAGNALVVGDFGYSAYYTKGNYGLGATYDEQNMRKVPATVLPTTGFRAIAGKKLVVDAEAWNGIEAEVTIPEVAAGQKGVNFAFRTSKEVVDNESWLTIFKKGIKSFSFGFKGQQVIASDFTIDVDLNCTYYELRQAFREKLEEEDVLKFYILKDGKAFDEFVVDFMTQDDSENVEIQIPGKAGTNLGYYTITLTAPAAEEGETNPDTGAESMIGVVAAMAVVTLASAAAISLKK